MHYGAECKIPMNFLSCGETSMNAGLVAGCFKLRPRPTPAPQDTCLLSSAGFALVGNFEKL